MRSSTRDRIDALERGMRGVEGLAGEVRELTSELRRLVIVVEQRSTPSPLPVQMPRPARVPTSWHQMIREKQVTVPRAAVWSTVLYALVELVRAVLDGRLRLW